MDDDDFSSLRQTTSTGNGNRGKSNVAGNGNASTTSKIEDGKNGNQHGGDQTQGEGSSSSLTTTAATASAKAKRKGNPSMVSALSNILSKIFIDSGAMQTAIVNFLLAYNLRAGVSVLLRILTLASKLDRKVFSISEIVSEKHLHFQEEAIRIGLFLGGYTGLYKAVTAMLKLFSTTRAVIAKSTTPNDSNENGNESTKDKSENENKSEMKSERWWHSFVAGTLAGSTLMFMDPSWHRTLALYIATRAAQCLYNFSKARGYFHFWGSSWNHGDSLLFTLSSAQIMYAYVMRPETLPPSYYRFIRTQGPLDEVVLQAVRDNNRNLPVNMGDLISYIQKKGGQEAIDAVKPYLAGATPDTWNEFPRVIPCRAMHPYTRFCSLHTFKAFYGVAKQIFPVYFSLAFMPAVVLRFRTFSKTPFDVFFKSVLSAIQSTIFLSTFCSSYQGVVCVQREILDLFNLGDHRFTYYVAGLMSSLAILIERKSRRSELALYALPRAADSIYLILSHHKLVTPLPQGELLLFMLSMGFCMFFYEHDRDSMSPIMAKVLERFLPTNETLEAMRRSQSYGFFSDRTSSSQNLKVKDREENNDDEEEDDDGHSKKPKKSSDASKSKTSSELSLSGSTLIP